jgi:crooked neck
MLWKEYIDFEISEGESVNARNLYRRLLQRTSHVKVWISYGKFESIEAMQQFDNEDERSEALKRMRDVFREG